MRVDLLDIVNLFGIICDIHAFLFHLIVHDQFTLSLFSFLLQKNFHKGLEVLKQMDASDVKPDSHTFSYIIGNCNTEDDIIKVSKFVEVYSFHLTECKCKIQ